MKIHILGICGTFMGGIALLAKQAGHDVSGCDANVYPPMSDQLAEQGIVLCEGFFSKDIPDDVDEVVIGNALSRGNEVVEYVLNRNITYSSGPEWLARHVLKQRWVIAVAGTHGKTTTSSMIAWILQYANLNPGFLIGGIPANFGLSARIGEAPFFVVEADEYDTAFFDKRSKFLHYHPRTAVLNNLEFDHADIFENLDAIKKQFHHFVRTIPGDGLIVKNGGDENVAAVLKQGCWSQVTAFHKTHDDKNINVHHSDDDWSIGKTSKDGKQFEVLLDGKVVASVCWSQHGLHNRMNALAAIAAAQHAGVPVEFSCEALTKFKGIKRRLEVRGVVNGITVYDDFAHHPTAIKETLAAMKEVKGNGKVYAVLEPRSNTMRMGIHKESLSDSWQQADEICLYQAMKLDKGLDWNLADVALQSTVPATVFSGTEKIIEHLVSKATCGDHILIMSNGGFEAIHQRLLDALKTVNSEP